MVKNEIPVLKCYPTKSGQVKAWCPFCKKWHTHGHPEKITVAKNIGHRNAHCDSEKSLFDKTGYYLQLMTKEELTEIADSLKLYGR